MAEFSLKDTLIGGGLLFGIGVFLKFKKGKKKVNLDYDNWGGNPDGKLAKALAKAREESKKPREPLKIERLDAEGIREGRYGSILNFEFFDFGVTVMDISGTSTGTADVTGWKVILNILTYLFIYL